ncbi:hypothetical protein KC350_g15 [Hortaea werneckii]|nr:hypothetical protein KC350_g15 [Hortaea werneckii]
MAHSKLSLPPSKREVSLSRITSGAEGTIARCRPKGAPPPPQKKKNKRQEEENQSPPPPSESLASTGVASAMRILGNLPISGRSGAPVAEERGRLLCSTWRGPSASRGISAVVVAAADTATAALANRRGIRRRFLEAFAFVRRRFGMIGCIDRWTGRKSSSSSGVGGSSTSRAYRFRRGRKEGGPFRRCRPGRRQRPATGRRCRSRLCCLSGRAGAVRPDHSSPVLLILHLLVATMLLLAFGFGRFNDHVHAIPLPFSS